MKLATIIFVCTDDDEELQDQKFQVQFFQFNPKDLAIGGLGGRKGKRKEHSKRSNTDTLPKSTNTTSLNATTNTSNENTTSSTTNSTAVKPIGDNSTLGVTRDTDIMNSLIDMAIKKNISAPATTNTSAIDSTVDSSSNATSNVTGTVTKKGVIAGKARKDVLNPNPQPSEQDAMLNIKAPNQLEGKPHDALIHIENTTKVVNTTERHAVTKNALSMEKNNNTVPEPEAGNSTQNVTANSEEEKENERQRKLAKDKQTNKEIKENAKGIKPIQNTVDQINGSIHNPLKDESSNNGRSKVDHVDEGKTKHRNNVAKFVPLYKTSAKDHKLSFQIGAMKHPKHNIHPKCHACPLNSTYKECVKKSTLLECNRGLDNICFTKSTKKNGVITYQMGCADHNKCVNAKAFPCKDDTIGCFTCCQFDRCNSSPHFGDYELDDLNLTDIS